jgi:hypothetical protein
LAPCASGVQISPSAFLKSRDEIIPLRKYLKKRADMGTFQFKRKDMKIVKNQLVKQQF